MNILFALLATAPLEAATYVIEYKLPSPPRIGAGLSIAVDAGGNPHLAYNRDNDVTGSFRHAYKQSGSWHYNTIVDRAGGFSSLAFNGGVLHGSYQDVPFADCRFATYSGSTWTTELVSNIFPVEGLHTSLAFDQAGTPLIAYHEGGGGDNAILAYPFGSGWLGEIAAGADFSDGLQGLYTSLALSPDDTVFISHVGIGTGGQQRVRLSELSTDWGTIDVAPTLTPLAFATSVVSTATGQPLVAFVASGIGAPSGVLYFAERVTFSTWSLVPVDTLGSTSDLEMKLDTLGQPHIAYRRNLELRHAYRDLTLGWRRETVDAPALGIVSELDLAIDGTDALHIGYLARQSHPEATITPVYYALGSFGSWTIEAVEGVEDEGSFLAATTTAAGEPIVAFYDATLRDLQVCLRGATNNSLDDDIWETGDVGRFVTMPPRVPSAGLGCV